MGLTFVGCDSVAASALLVASCAIGGALYGCDAILPIDLAPEFAGTLLLFVTVIVSHIRKETNFDRKINISKGLKIPYQDCVVCMIIIVTIIPIITFYFIP